MQGGEIFVPKIPSMNIMDVARAVAPDCRTEFVGIRAGEKLHEVMVPEDDAGHTMEYDNHFVILPSGEQRRAESDPTNGGRRCPDDFRYSSDSNSQWLTVEELQKILRLSPEAGVD
jgi:UDP-N-acetylglucosamine 4,6-dehydratase